MGRGLQITRDSLIWTCDDAADPGVSTEQPCLASQDHSRLQLLCIPIAPYGHPRDEGHRLSAVKCW
jgi:hypothetical protein